MVNIFLDANILIYWVKGVKKYESEILGKDFFISSLTVHLLFYILKRKVLDSQILSFLEGFTIVDFTDEITAKALKGPTNDFEDNVQLHSAVAADSRFFYTKDKGLLKMKYFGSMEILKP